MLPTYRVAPPAIRKLTNHAITIAGVSDSGKEIACENVHANAEKDPGKARIGLPVE